MDGSTKEKTPQNTVLILKKDTTQIRKIFF